MEVAAQEGDGLGDGARLLERRPEAAKLGFLSARYFQRSSSSEKWRPVFLSFLRIQRRQRRPKATTDDDERRGWSGAGAWREKESAGRAIPVAADDGT
uniref:DUF834 domain-containing protein n=1 Tax=Oryza glaberrima TaxID=4538 RepID=I1PU30_ORYGL